MNLKEVIDIIQHKDYLFQISIPGSALNHGRTSLANAISNAGSLQEYFDKIIKANSAKMLLVELFSPNGTSYKNRGKHVIILDQTEAVATNATNTTNVANKATQTLQGFNDQHQKPTTNAMMDAKDKLEFEVLKMKHQMLEGIKNSLECECKDLRKKVDNLQEERLELVKQNSVATERNKLEMEKAVFDVQKQSKEGLSGILEEVKENPELLKMIAGFINPNHPMFKENGESMQGTQQIEAPRYHDNEQVNALLSDMPNTIKSLDPKTISKIYLIFMQGFAKDPQNVQKVFEMLFPEEAAKEKQ